MRVLGLDPSLTNFGWTVYDSAAPEGQRCLCRGRFQTSAEMIFIDRNTAIRDALYNLITEVREKYEVGFVASESPIFCKDQAEAMYGLFLYTNEAIRDQKIDVVFFAPLQAKAVARDILRRPKGWKMDKPDMVEAAKKHSGQNKVWDHNEADAYWVAYCGARFWELQEGTLKTTDLTAQEKKMFLEVHTFVKGKNKGKTVLKGISFKEDARFFRWSMLEERKNGTTSKGKSTGSRRKGRENREEDGKGFAVVRSFESYEGLESARS